MMSEAPGGGNDLYSEEEVAPGGGTDLYSEEVVYSGDYYVDGRVVPRLGSKVVLEI